MIPALQIICTEDSISIKITENIGINKSRNITEKKVFREEGIPRERKESLVFNKGKLLCIQASSSVTEF